MNPRGVRAGAPPPSRATLVTADYRKEPSDEIRLEGHDPERGSIFCVAVGGEGTSAGPELYTGSADHSVRVWDARTGRCKRELFKNGGHHDWVTCIGVLPDGGSIVSGAMDNQILLWPRGSARSTQLGLQSSISALVVMPSGIVATAGYDGYVRSWSVTGRGGDIDSCQVDPNAVTVMVRGSKENQLICGGRRGTVAVAIIGAHGELDLDWKATFHSEALVSVCPCPDSLDDVVSGGGDGRVVVWRGRKIMWKSQQHKGTITFVHYDAPTVKGVLENAPRVIYGTSTGEVLVRYLGKADSDIALPTLPAGVTCGLVRTDIGIIILGLADGVVACFGLPTHDNPSECKPLWYKQVLKFAIHQILFVDSLGRLVVVGEEAVAVELCF